MKSYRATTVCLVYDQPIANWVGTKAAQAFDWLYAFLHLSNKENGHVYEGRRWGQFTYNQLFELSDALPNSFAWRRAINHLVQVGILYRDPAPGRGNYYAINFHAIKARLGEEGFGGYMMDMERQKAPLSNWLSPDPPKNRSNTSPLPASGEGSGMGSNQTAQPPPEQNAQPTLSTTLSPPEQNAQTSPYIDDSYINSSNDLTSTTLTPHQKLVEKFREVTFGCVPGRKVDVEADSKRCNKQITNISNKFEKPTAAMMTAWLVWRVFLDEWNKNSSLPTKPSDVPPTWPRFLQFHAKDPNWLARFESKYADWMVYIYKSRNPGDLRQKIQANVASRTKPKLRDYQLGIHKPGPPMIKMTDEELQELNDLIERNALQQKKG